MSLTWQRAWRRARTLGAMLTAGAVFQTTGCSPDLSALVFDWVSTILGQLITSYVSDQLGVTGAVF